MKLTYSASYDGISTISYLKWKYVFEVMLKYVHDLSGRSVFISEGSQFVKSAEGSFLRFLPACRWQ